MRDDGYYGTLRWYEADPSPESRRQLSRVLNRWVAEAVVFDDWKKAGSPGPCPMPEPLRACPDLGQWLLDEVEGRAPTRATQRLALGELIAASKRRETVVIWARAPEPVVDPPAAPSGGWLGGWLRRWRRFG